MSRVLVAIVNRQEVKQMYFRKYLSMLGVCGMVVFMVGCGTLKAYTGPELPDNNTALIKSDYRFPFHMVQIISIDNYTTTSANARVLPGHHSLTVELYQSYVITHVTVRGNISIDARAGYRYILEGRMDGLGAVFDIKELADSQTSSQ